MSTKSTIDFGNIVLGKRRFTGGGIAEDESERATERMRLQILAGNRLRREAERQRIRVQREARQRTQFEALQEKRAEEYHIEQRRMEVQEQYQRHLQRYRQDKLRSRVPAQQENREDVRQRLEEGRSADKVAEGSSAQELQQAEELSEWDLQQRRERRHYTSTYFGV